MGRRHRRARRTAREDVGVGRLVAGVEALDRLACRDADTLRLQHAQRRGGEPGLADLGAGAGDEGQPVGSPVHSWASAAPSASTCAGVCAADSATRSRDVPGATVGGRMAGTSIP